MILFQNRRIRFALLLAIILVSIAAVVLPFAAPYSGKAGPRAKNGVLDLREWSLDKDGAVRLNGTWSFYWERLLTSADILGANAAKSNLLAEVPGVWTRFGKPGRGYATPTGKTDRSVCKFLP
ncbi:hypothetical protein [Paenibacillus piri]|uniref:Uncharacterized protein n=1 Tax=Paenibacillus piri TaxID=2547395 RepID=A0A4R5KI27_9BACL|nr:hypothetical protein [Paenibacillus piri]TDF95159.1 hypothetical protein E1757_21785 [Paenibacillus piri]